MNHRSEIIYAPRTPEKDTPDPTEALLGRVHEGWRSAPECFVIRLDGQPPTMGHVNAKLVGDSEHDFFSI